MMTRGHLTETMSITTPIIIKMRTIVCGVQWKLKSACDTYFCDKKQATTEPMRITHGGILKWTPTSFLPLFSLPGHWSQSCRKMLCGCLPKRSHHKQDIFHYLAKKKLVQFYIFILYTKHTYTFLYYYLFVINYFLCNSH